MKISLLVLLVACCVPGCATVNPETTIFGELAQQNSGWILTDCVSQQQYSTTFPSTVFYHYTQQTNALGINAYKDIVLVEFSGHTSKDSQGHNYFSVMNIRGVTRGSCQE